MMDQSQRELRQAAAEAFMESLDQLQETLQSSPEPPAIVAPVNPEQPRKTSSSQFDLDTFEQAVADIEEFIEQQQKQQG